MSLQYRLQIETNAHDFTINLENLGGPQFCQKSQSDYVTLQKSVCIYMSENELSIDKEALRLIKSLQKDVLLNKKKDAEEAQEKKHNIRDKAPDDLIIGIDKPILTKSVDFECKMENFESDISKIDSPVRNLGGVSPDLPQSVVLQIYNTDEIYEGVADVENKKNGLNSNKKSSDANSNQSASTRKFGKKQNVMNVSCRDNKSRSSSRRISNRIYSPFKYPLLQQNTPQESKKNIDTQSIFTTKSQISSLTTKHIEFEVELIKGKKEGLGKWFHKNGKQRFEGIFKNDGPDGDVILLYSNGNILKINNQV